MPILTSGKPVCHSRCAVVVRMLNVFGAHEYCWHRYRRTGNIVLECKFDEHVLLASPEVKKISTLTQKLTLPSRPHDAHLLKHRPT